MRVVVKYVIGAMLLFMTSIANAQTNGCYVVGTDKMYYQTPTPGDPTTFFEGAAFYISQANCSGNGQFFSIASGPSGINCYADFDGNGNGSGAKTNPSKYNIQGVKATFNLLICPIDGYTVFLMALLAGVGFIFLRRTATTTAI